MLKSLTCIALLAAGYLVAQVNQLVSRPILSKEFDLDGVFIPSTPTTVIDQNIWVTGITLVNVTENDVQCSVADRQGTPIPLIPNTASGAIGAGSIYPIVLPKTKMTAGIRWSCATPNAVTGRISGFIQ
jgi:hypothetical protein